MKDNKIFLITIDTEGDNQWDVKKGISTENSKYIPRFQELSEKYGFKPTWLTNYEMANDEYYVNYMKPRQEKGLCEIGMHLHAWNSPPEYKLNKINEEREYLIEYPKNVMESKIDFLTKVITEKFGIKPVSHRSGRWTTNGEYLEMLEKKGFLIDCSVTPHINWQNCLGATGIPGSNYMSFPEKPYYIKNNLLEVPMTIRKMHDYQIDRIKEIKNIFGEFKRLITGRAQWMRPDKNLNKSGLKHLTNKCLKNGEYIMFMIHSSELMPNGSPNFKTGDDIEELYEIIDYIFEYLKKNDYIGMTLKEYYDFYKGENYD